MIYFLRYFFPLIYYFTMRKFLNSCNFFLRFQENRVLDSSMLTNRFPVTNPYGSSNQESVAYSLPRSSEAMYVSKNIETPQTPYNPAFRTTLPAHRSPVDAIAKRMEHVELSQQQQQSSMGPSQENVYICRPADRSLVSNHLFSKFFLNPVVYFLEFIEIYR